MDLKPMVDKAFSGRYFLTVVTGIVFAYVAIRKTINADVVATIITMVFTLYFTRTDRNGQPPKGA